MSVCPVSSSICGLTRRGILLGLGSKRLSKHDGGSFTCRHNVRLFNRCYHHRVNIARENGGCGGAKGSVWLLSSPMKTCPILGPKMCTHPGLSLDFTRGFNISQILGKDADNDEGLASFSNPFGKDFGAYQKIMPGNVSDVVREIPDYIEKPNYYKTGHPPIKLGRRNESIEIKTPEVIEKMRKSCTLARRVLSAVVKEVKPGVTTEQLDDFVFNYTIAQGAYPSPLNYKGFPKSVCTSVNNVACHGIPDDRALVDGDIINIDVMVYLDGYHGDCSETVLVGSVDAKGQKLVEAAKACLDRGILVCGPGVPFTRIGQTIEDVAEEQGFSVVPAFTGHGIGNQIHGPPDIYHYESLVQQENINDKFIDFPYPGKMAPGMTFTIEPVLTQGMEDVVILPDGWTAVTLDGSRTAQFEHTILITKDGAEILT